VKAHNHYALCPECERLIAELESVLADFVAWSAAPTPPLHPWLPDVVKAARRALSGAAQPRGEGARCWHCSGGVIHAPEAPGSDSHSWPCPYCDGTGRAPDKCSCGKVGCPAHPWTVGVDAAIKAFREGDDDPGEPAPPASGAPRCANGHVLGKGPHFCDECGKP
jgi:hypothetical protein